MAIHKKFIHFKTFANFNSQKLSANEQDTQYTLGINGEIQNGSPTILYNSICYIKDTKQQWTHGQLYDCGGTSNTKEPFYFTVNNIESLTMSCFEFSNLIEAHKLGRPIFLRYNVDDYNLPEDLADLYYNNVIPVSVVYNNSEIQMSFIYAEKLYHIIFIVSDIGEYCSDEQSATIIPIDSIYIKPNGGIPKTDLSSDVQTILNNSLTENDIYDDSFIKANGIVDVEDHYYRLPSEVNSDPNFTLATKSDINVQAVDTGDVIDDVNVNYATTAYVDGLIGDINSVLENIINS